MPQNTGTPNLGYVGETKAAGPSGPFAEFWGTSDPGTISDPATSRATVNNCNPGSRYTNLTTGSYWKKNSAGTWVQTAA